MSAAALHKIKLLAFSSLLALSIAGCATAPQDPVQLKEFEAANDPLEPMNRKIFEVNTFLDHLLWGPISGAYQALIPPPVRDHVHDFLSNLDEPINFMNNALQAQFGRASTTAGRFLVNTTIGIGGIFDVATDWNMPEQHGDFGQTLWSWGVGEGPYLVLPFFGPSNPRDTTGLVVDAIADPWGYVMPTADDQLKFDISRFAAEGIDRRAEAGDALESLEKSSVDFYAEMRSIARQYRATELRGGPNSDADQYKDIYHDDIYGDAAPAAASQNAIDKGGNPQAHPHKHRAKKPPAPAASPSTPAPDASAPSPAPTAPAVPTEQ